LLMSACCSKGVMATSNAPLASGEMPATCCCALAEAVAWARACGGCFWAWARTETTACRGFCLGCGEMSARKRRAKEAPTAAPARRQRASAAERFGACVAPEPPGNGRAGSDGDSQRDLTLRPTTTRREAARAGPAGAVVDESTVLFWGGRAALLQFLGFRQRAGGEFRGPEGSRARRGARAGDRERGERPRSRVRGANSPVDCMARGKGLGCLSALSLSRVGFFSGPVVVGGWLCARARYVC
jgi:hypothetical protein